MKDKILGTFTNANCYQSEIVLGEDGRVYICVEDDYYNFSLTKKQFIKIAERLEKQENERRIKSLTEKRKEEE